MASLSPLRIFSAIHIFFYRRTGGALGGKLLGMSQLLLTTTGRTSGRAITKPLTYLPDGDNYVIIASNGGSDLNPLWFLNIKAKPEVEIQVGPKVMAATARVATPEDASQIWPRIDAVYSQYKGYRSKTSRPIPLVILTTR